MTEQHTITACRGNTVAQAVSGHWLWFAQAHNHQACTNAAGTASWGQRPPSQAPVCHSSPTNKQSQQGDLRIPILAMVCSPPVPPNHKMPPNMCEHQVVSL